ncbi:MAG: hypothetical protein LBV70_06345, partial [Candidatus Adiutrix sp.]|nr:hypothetical protein [Candidatus Adiutrix sp.]
MAEVTRAGLKAEEPTQKNLAALAAGGQNLALAWLEKAPETGPVSLAEAATGEAVVLAGGRSQASRRDPEAEAGTWLAEAWPAARDPIIFGFGQPWAARLLLEAGRPLAVFEPDPLVALAVLSRHDFSSALAEARLRLLTPWHLADPAGLAREIALSPALLISPAARRRAPAQLAHLARRLAPSRALRQAGPDFRLLVIPPLSGGPAPVAEALARAAAGLGFQVLCLDWGADLKSREKAAQGPASADKDRALAGLLEEAGARAAAEAAVFRPALAVALAQAPLTVPALSRLRDRSPETVLAFWLVEDFR